MNKWTNGRVEVKQVTEDKVRIASIYGYCIIDGGDFQQVLEALITAYMAGKNAHTYSSDNREAQK